MDIHSRTELLLGEESTGILKGKRVALFGLGGVGGNAFEALVRSGIGHIDVIDESTFEESNLNRQILSTISAVGARKVDAAYERAKSIDPSVEVTRYFMTYLPERRSEIPFENYDYIIDAIDTVTAKLDLIVAAKELNIPIISVMGCGNRLDPSKLVISDLFNSVGDPLAKLMKRELRKRNILSLKSVYSTELPLTKGKREEVKIIPSSPFVPTAAGIFAAYEVVKDLLNFDGNALRNINFGKNNS